MGKEVIDTGNICTAMAKRVEKHLRLFLLRFQGPVSYVQESAWNNL